MTKKFLVVFVAVLILVCLVGCAASKKPGNGSATQPEQNNTTLLTAEEAQTIALEHAELTVEQVTQLRTRYDADDPVPEYEVEFRQGDYEYDYTIHAETGKILEHDRELDSIDSPAPSKQETTVATEPATEPTVPDKTQTEKSKLSREQAEAIALQHAGFKAEQVKGLRSEYEKDDGIPEYSVEFRQGDYEYDYTVHAETGKILKHDKEFDPIDAPASAVPVENPTAATQPAKLSRKEAEDIALKHAGVKSDEVKGLKTEYEIDDGVPEYSVEFIVNGWELEYEIHAETGEILEHHKEPN